MEGEAFGEIRMAQEAIETARRSRGIEVPAEGARAIAGCHELGTLRRWRQRAATAAEVVAGPRYETQRPRPGMRIASRVLVGVFSMLSPAGCSEGAIATGPCPPQEHGHPRCSAPETAAGDGGGGRSGVGGRDGAAGGAGGAGGGGDERACTGDCIPPPPPGWLGPVLLWYGPLDQAPDCPAAAPNITYEGFADLAPAPVPCAPCVCDPPAPETVSCQLPRGWSAHAPAACSGEAPAPVATTFAAPEAWDGACTAANAIPAGQDCGGQPCVQSLSIEAPAVLVTGACTPRVEDAPPLPHFYPWQTRARACAPSAPTRCPDDRGTCMPSPEQPGVPPPSGFRACIFREGDVACAAPYPDKHVFFGDIEDTRDCSPCGCGEPEGASCTIKASVYSDGACAEQVASTLIRSTAPYCGVMPPGVALGSKSAEVVAVEPGGCAPHGGEPIGELLPAGPSTFCCRP